MTLNFTDEQLAGFPPEAQAIIRALAAEAKRLKARVAELEAQLGKTPKNSSAPPSSQHPHAKFQFSTFCWSSCEGCQVR
jgi:hypothetical protein